MLVIIVVVGAGAVAGVWWVICVPQVAAEAARGLPKNCRVQRRAQLLPLELPLPAAGVLQ